MSDGLEEEDCDWKISDDSVNQEYCCDDCDVVVVGTKVVVGVPEVRLEDEAGMELTEELRPDGKTMLLLRIGLITLNKIENRKCT